MQNEETFAKTILCRGHFAGTKVASPGCKHFCHPELLKETEFANLTK